MRRRAFVRSLLACALGALFTRTAGAHTPYRQWKILRQRFLLVHSSRSDPVSDAIAEGMVNIFDDVLPQANAMVARAPDEQRIASLLTTGQAVLAVMRTDLAVDLYRRDGAFRDFEGGQLRSLVSVGDHLLVSVASFPRHHAWLVTAALAENGETLEVRLPDQSAEGVGVPLHDGARAFADGESLESQQ
jgi:hypothetical protein